MDYRKEKALKVTISALGATFFIYTLLGSVLLFSIFGGKSKRWEKADFQMILEDFQRQILGCANSFMGAESEVVQHFNKSKQLFFKCSSDSASLLALTMESPFEVESFVDVTFLQCVQTAFSLTLSFGEVTLCDGDRNAQCQLITAFYSLVGVLIHFLFALTLSILISFRLLSLVMNLPYLEIHQQIIVVSNAFLAVEVILIALMAFLIFVMDSEENALMDVLSSAAKYLSFSGTGANLFGEGESAFLKDLLFKLIAACNGHFTVTISLLILRIGNRRFKGQMHVILGSTSTGVSSKPRSAVELYNSLSRGATLTLNPHSSNSNNPLISFGNKSNNGSGYFSGTSSDFLFLQPSNGIPNSKTFNQSPDNGSSPRDISPDHPANGNGLLDTLDSDLQFGQHATLARSDSFQDTSVC